VRPDTSIRLREARVILKHALQTYDRPTDLAVYCVYVRLGWNELRALLSRLSRDGFDVPTHTPDILDTANRVESHLMSSLRD